MALCFARESSMRVLMINKRAPFEGRGAEQVIWRMGKRFAEAGHRVRFFCPVPTSEAVVPSVPGVDFSFIETSGDPTRSMIEFFVRGPLDYREVYRSFSPDIVYDNPSPFPFVPAHFYGDAEVVSKVHAIYRRLSFGCKDHPLVKVGTIVGEETYRIYRGEQFETNSESTSERLRELVDTTSNDVVANPIGIDSDEFEFEYRPDSDLVLSLSKLSPRKRLVDLLRAWPEVSSMVPTARLVIAGSGPQEEKLRRIAERQDLDRVSFAGFVSEERKHELLQEAAVFASPTLYEGFGISNLEAMASGCAVVSTDTWGIKDYLEHRLNGFRVPPRSPEELGDAIVELLQDEPLRKRVAHEGAKTAQQYPISESMDRALANLETVAPRDPSG